MLKQHTLLYRRLLMAADISVVVGAFLLTYHIRKAIEGFYPLEACLWILPTIVILWIGLMYFAGMYHSLRFKSIGQVLWAICHVAVVAFLIFGALVFVLNLPYVSRSFIVFIFIFTTQAFMFERVVLDLLFRYIRKKGFNYRNVLIVGTGPRARKFISQVELHREFGFKIIGLVDDELEGSMEKMSGYKVIGYLKDIPEIIRQNAIDYVVFIVPRNWLGRIEEPILYCETVGVSASVAVDLFDLQFTTGKESHLFGVPLLTFESTSDKVGQLCCKRIMDILLSGAALVLLFPLFAVVAVFTKMTSQGPVFFTQIRSGLNGRHFKLYKFRTMVVDAEARLESLQHLNEMKGPVFKIEKDPRITFVGKYLRKFSIDELPQLWNVFKGEMSLVGPRPPLPKEVAQYDHWQRRRLSMRPGITCIWQVSGRNGITDFVKWMKLDLEYIDHWSLWLDIMILLKTIPVVIIAKGAK